MRRRRSGYILVETVVSLGLLSISIVGIHESLRQAIMVRARAQDYSVARVLMEQLAAEVAMQPEMQQSTRSGNFPPPYDRFAWEWKYARVEVPMPPIPPEFDEERARQMRQMFKGAMGKLRVRVHWMRGGDHFELTGETLFKPEHLWLPEQDLGGRF
jgi:hypothetical protein